MQIGTAGIKTGIKINLCQFDMHGKSTEKKKTKKNI